MGCGSELRVWRGRANFSDYVCPARVLSVNFGAILKDTRQDACRPHSPEGYVPETARGCFARLTRPRTDNINTPPTTPNGAMK